MNGDRKLQSSQLLGFCENSKSLGHVGLNVMYLSVQQGATEYQHSFYLNTSALWNGRQSPLIGD